MSTLGINQVLAQMRTMEASVRNVETTNPTTGLEQTGKTDFGDILSESINEVNDRQMRAKELTNAFSAGDTGVDLPEVMVALQQSSVSFQAVSQVRNKLLTAYQEVMSMQV